MDVRFPDPPPPEATPPWEIGGRRCAPRRAGGLAGGGIPVRQSAGVPADAEAAAYAAPSFPAGRPLLAALLELNERIRRDFTFRAGVTTTATTDPRGDEPPARASARTSPI